VFVQGRDSDMIIRGGANISPLEIEGVLTEHPSVEQSVVLGIPDETHGQQVVAIVLPIKGKTCSSAELADHCAANLARFKVPKRIYLADKFPRNANGKILRPELRAIMVSPEHPGWRSFNIRPG
jgi:acyl-CoA synthetase (AMP-forming)/AMP-acid ligase II